MAAIFRILELITAIMAAIYLAVNLWRLFWRWKHGRMLLPVIFLIILCSEIAESACTIGTDCFCDTAPTNLFCEGFDAPTLYQNTGAGGGTPYYGPWWDDTANCNFGTWRGCNAYWTHKYSTGVSSYRTVVNFPVTPTFGNVCGNGFTLCANNVYLNGNLNNTNGTGGGVAVQMGIMSVASDFSAIIGTEIAPTNTRSGTAGVYDGNANLGFIIPAGQSGGIAGETTFSPTTHLGVTYAVALPLNHVTSGISSCSGDCNWKWDEWIQTNETGFQYDSIAGFAVLGSGSADNPQVPFTGFIQMTTGTCATVRAAEVINKGAVVQCQDNNTIQFRGDTSYQFPRDWPLGTWACVRMEMDLSTITNVKFKQWILSSVLTSETLVTDISGWDFTGTSLTGGYKGIKWNAYSNANQGLGGTPTNATTFRYEDNMIVTNGTPVSCAQIGFSGSSGGGTTSAPGNAIMFVEWTMLVMTVAWHARAYLLRAAIVGALYTHEKVQIAKATSIDMTAYVLDKAARTYLTRRGQ